MPDVFISHASEDKQEIATPLAIALRDAGYTVWYDEFSLKLGDSLRESIERGLADSRYGVVVLSPHFFQKRWPQQELNGLFALESTSGQKRILPVLHKLSFAELAKHSPMLADRLGVSTVQGLDVVVNRLREVLTSGSHTVDAAPASRAATVPQTLSVNMPAGYARRVRQLEVDAADRRNPHTGEPIPPKDVDWSQGRLEEKNRGHAVLIPEYLKATRFGLAASLPKIRLWNLGDGRARHVQLLLDGRRLDPQHPLYESGPSDIRMIEPEACVEFALKLPKGVAERVELLSVWHNFDLTLGKATMEFEHLPLEQI